MVGVSVTTQHDVLARSVTFSFGRGVMTYAVSVSHRELSNMDSAGVSWLVARLAEQFRAEESRRLAGALGDLASGFAEGVSFNTLTVDREMSATFTSEVTRASLEMLDRGGAHVRRPKKAASKKADDVSSANGFGRRKIRLEGKD